MMTGLGLTVLQAGVLRPLIAASLEMGLMGPAISSLPSMDLPLAGAVDSYNLGNSLVSPSFRSGPVDPKFVEVAKGRLPALEAGSAPVRAIDSDLLEAVVDTRPSGVPRGGRWFVLENSTQALRVAQLMADVGSQPAQPLTVSGARVDFIPFARYYYATRLEYKAQGWGVARQDLGNPELVISGYAYGVETSGITTLAALREMRGVTVKETEGVGRATRVTITVNLEESGGDVPVPVLRLATAVLRDVRMMSGYNSQRSARLSAETFRPPAGPPI